MYCTYCNFQNESESKFCESCGKPLKETEVGYIGPKIVSKRTSGSKLGALSSMAILVAFFLPWVRACNRELTGYEIATNSTGQIEDAWIYWLTFIAPIFCLMLFIFVKNTSAASRIGAAIARLAAGLLGLLPLLNILYNVQQKGGSMEILYGGWITALGYAGITLSFFIDLFSSTKETT